MDGRLPSFHLIPQFALESGKTKYFSSISLKRISKQQNVGSRAWPLLFSSLYCCGLSRAGVFHNAIDGVDSILSHSSPSFQEQLDRFNEVNHHSIALKNSSKDTQCFLLQAQRCHKADQRSSFLTVCHAWILPDTKSASDGNKTDKLTWIMSGTVHKFGIPKSFVTNVQCRAKVTQVQDVKRMKVPISEIGRAVRILSQTLPSHHHTNGCIRNCIQLYYM